MIRRESQVNQTSYLMTKDVLLYARLVEMQVWCEKMGAWDVPESPILRSAAKSFGKIINDVERRFKNDELE